MAKGTISLPTTEEKVVYDYMISRGTPRRQALLVALSEKLGAFPTAQVKSGGSWAMFSEEKRSAILSGQDFEMTWKIYRKSGPDVITVALEAAWTFRDGCSTEYHLGEELRRKMTNG